eukprot:m.107692 g.107692  ORF g.107692 m.107692 type:complete len:131 (-) comp13330_c0_seq7:1765-2157(-)
MTWLCDLCTFENTSGFQCAMCQAPRRSQSKRKAREAATFSKLATEQAELFKQAQEQLKKPKKKPPPRRKSKDNAADTAQLSDDASPQDYPSTEPPPRSTAFETEDLIIYASAKKPHSKFGINDGKTLKPV